jgi:hypothetical protein
MSLFKETLLWKLIEKRRDSCNDEVFRTVSHNLGIAINKIYNDITTNNINDLYRQKLNEQK